MVFRIILDQDEALAKIANDNAFDSEEFGPKEIWKLRDRKAVNGFKKKIGSTCEAKRRRKKAWPQTSIVGAYKDS